MMFLFNQHETFPKSKTSASRDNNNPASGKAHALEAARQETKQMKSKSHDANADSLTRLVKRCAANHTPEELALGWLRYELVRTMTPKMFGDICKRNLSGECFDDIITQTLNQPR